MIEYFIYFSVFLAAILLFEATVNAFATRRARNRSVNRRLATLQNLPEHGIALPVLLAERGVFDEDAGTALLAWLRKLWTQSGLTITPVRLVALTTGAAVVITTAISIFLPFLAKIYVIIPMFIVLTLGLPVVVLRRLKNGRIRRFTAQLPDALDVIVRSLKAGHPVSTSISLVGREMPDPIGTEFGIVSDEMTFGLDVESAMANLFERVGADELRLLVTTISIQRSTGGNLAEVLQNLGSVIRERLHMKARIRAISAEGRLTAWVMVFFPFIMYFLINWMAPYYYDTFWDSPIAIPVIVGCLVLLAIGDYIVFKLVAFDF